MKNLLFHIKLRIKGALWFLFYNGQYRFTADTAMICLMRESTQLTDDGHVLHVECYPEGSGWLNGGYCGPILDKYSEPVSMATRRIFNVDLDTVMTETITTGDIPTTFYKADFN